MKRPSAIVALTMVAIFTGLGYLAFMHDGGRLPSRGDNERMARFERQQQKKYDLLNEKIDRLAASVASGNVGAHADPRAGGMQAGAVMPERITPQQYQAQQAQSIQSLDRQLESQPVDAKWSLESTRIIEKALGADSLKAVGASSPAASDIQCRSSMCRIQLVYGDGGSAGDAGMMLNASIAERMPYAQVLSQMRSDGGVAYIVYATRDAPVVR
jgi:hypothetical protein